MSVSRKTIYKAVRDLAREEASTDAARDASRAGLTNASRTARPATTMTAIAF